MQLVCLLVMILMVSSGSLQAAVANVQAIERLRSAIEECRAAVSAQQQPAVFETKNAICLVGVITAGLEESVTYFLKSNEKVFVVKSPGGNGRAAARIGLHILEKQVDVAVFDFCYSACANWVFLAGRKKYVPENTLLAWHGAPPRQLSPRQKVLDSAGFGALTIQLSDQFYRKARISSRLAEGPRSDQPDYPGWRERVNSTKADRAWTWTQRSLEQFGVTGIIGYWYPDPATLQNMALERGIDLLVDQ